MLTPDRQRVLAQAADAARADARARIGAAKAHGRKLATESMTFEDLCKWNRVPNTIAARQPFVGTEVEGFTFADTSEVRAFVEGVAEVMKEADIAANRNRRAVLSEAERDAQDKANGWTIIDPEGAERNIQERRETRRALIADYERRKAAGEDVEYPA